MNQTELAKKLKCSKATACRLMNGKSGVTMRVILALRCSKLMGEGLGWWLAATAKQRATKVKNYMAGMQI